MRPRTFAPWALIALCALFLAGCSRAPVAPTPAPVVQPSTSTVDAMYAAASKSASLVWQSWAGSRGRFSPKAAIEQHNEWGRDLAKVKAPQRGIDFTGNGPSVSWLKSNHISFVMFYVPGGGGSWKWPSASHVKAVRKAGIQIGWVFESTATRMRDGRSAGVHDAKVCLAARKKYGIPASAFFYFANDNASNQGVASYLAGVASVLGRAHTGLYGFGNVTNRYTVTRYSYDVDRSVKAYWGQEVPPKPKPQPKPKPSPKPHATPYPGHVIRKGAKGHAVALIKAALRKLGYRGMHADSVFGTGTAKAVLAAKRHHFGVKHQKADVGARTWAWLIK